MRITFTLEKDVAAALERMRKTRKASLKQAINDALRRGLSQMAAPRRVVRTRPVSLGGCLVGNVDNISEALAVTEKMSALLAGEYLEKRAARGSSARFKKALARVADREPEDRDRL